jgi:hypothetical protein
MVAIPEWLRARSENEDALCRSERRLAENAREQTGTHAQGGEIPIFCAGGCGEVVGYFSQAQAMDTTKGHENWCPACKAVDIAKKGFKRPDVPLANTDELAGLRESPRNLRWLRALQVACVVLITVGSAYIAMGRVIGIYLAALGTLGWLASVFAIWKLRD